jgi:hypothetical protein
MRAHPDSAEVQEEACLVLYNLAFDRENYRQVLQRTYTRTYVYMHT